MKIIKNSAIISFSLLLLIIGLLNSINSNVCVELDGRFNFESGANRCCEGFNRHSQDISKGNIQCEKCLDIPLLKSEATEINTVKDQSITFSAFKQLTTLLTSIIFTEYIAVQIYDYASFSLPQDPDHRRTTVLLI